VLTGRIDKCRRLPRVSRNVDIGGVVAGNKTRRAGVGEVTAIEFLVFGNQEEIRRGDAHRDLVRRSLSWAVAGNETPPCLVALVDDLCRVFFVLGLTRESKGVLALAIGDLVDPSRGYSCLVG
jgi:hypothetical protein